MPSIKSTKRAISHVTTFGDTDIFPTLPELNFLSERADEISEISEKLTLGGYSPQSAQEFLVPKSMMSFRIAHQLSAIDTMLYLASVLDNAVEIDSIRTPVEEEVSFSYRFVDGDGPNLYNIGVSFHDWLIKLTEYGGEQREGDRRAVIETDISDFYQRIYHHRVENIFNNFSNKKSTSFTKKIIKSVRVNQSFGIPVGQAASRLIAEAVLNDTDQYLISEGVAHTRYVDDFRIITEDETVAHATLCKLAEHLMVTEGLSLNGSKTAVHPIAHLRTDAFSRLGDALQDPDLKKFENYIKMTYDSDPTESHIEDNITIMPFSDADFIVDKILQFEDSGENDKNTFKTLLKLIKYSGGASPEKLLKIDKKWIYLAPRDYCLAFKGMDKSDAENVDKVKSHFIRLLNEIPYCDLSICRYWILELFNRGVLPFEWKDFQNYDFARSTVERRMEYFFRGRLGQAHFFRARKARFGDLSDWERPAFLMGATSLPQDEFNKWLISIKDQMDGPFSSTFLDWLKEKWGKLNDVLDYQI